MLSFFIFVLLLFIVFSFCCTFFFLLLLLICVVVMMFSVVCRCVQSILIFFAPLLVIGATQEGHTIGFLCTPTTLLSTRA